MEELHRSATPAPDRARRLPAARCTLLALAGLALAAACTPRGTFVRAEDLPADAPETEYRIAVGDVLGVRVWNQESMSTNHARVREDGRISVPFLQDVEAVGLTTSELAARLQSKLRSLLNSPVVTVTLEDARPVRVSVMGEVARSGQYDLDQGAGVLAALAAAGGLTEYAHRDEIYVLRSSGGQKAPLRIRFGYGALSRGEKQAAFRLRAGDVVVVE
ncbi:MAG: polysaccharide biosynthesis/export family protein [Anaeromyxobacter sp.]